MRALEELQIRKEDLTQNFELQKSLFNKVNNNNWCKQNNDSAEYEMTSDFS